MQTQILLETLAQLKKQTSYCPHHHLHCPLLALLDAKLPTLVHCLVSSQQELVLKSTELKQVSRRLKKTTSKLTKKQQEYELLQHQMQRVNQSFSQKIKKLTKTNNYFCEESQPEQERPKKHKKQAVGYAEVQCQILNHQAQNQLKIQNNILRDRLEQTQRQLLQEQLMNRDLNFRLEVLNVLHEPSEQEELKDNSTLDADSLRGDPFEDEKSQGEEESEEAELSSDGADCRRQGWMGVVWQSVVSVYQSLFPSN